jgi:cytochrome c556
MYSVIAGVGAVAVLAGVQSAPVLAQDDMKMKSVEMRQKGMKGLGGHNKVIVAYLKEGKGTPADVAKHAKEIASTAATIPKWFPKGTGEGDGVGDTRAKAEIWMKPDEFEKAAMNLADLAGKVAMAAESGNKGAIAAAFGNMGKNGCGGCHQVFRAPKN